MSQRDLVREIEERRVRVSERLRVLGPGRMGDLLRMAAEAAALDSGYLRLFPVSGIAAFEVFFRATIAEILDQSQVYLQRLSEAGLLKETKLDWTLLQAVVGRRITVGELVAHVLPLSSFGHLDRVLTSVLAKPFRSAVGEVVLRTPRIEGDSVPTPILQEPDADCECVARCFALRHQVAHEDYAPEELDQPTIVGLLQGLSRLTQAISELVDQELYPDAPLTQAEMNQQAGAVAQAAEDDLAAAWAGFQSVWASFPEEVGYHGRQALDALWSSFQALRSQRVELAARALDGGSMAPTIANAEYAAATREFAAAVRGLKSLYEPDWGTRPD